MNWPGDHEGMIFISYIDKNIVEHIAGEINVVGRGEKGKK